MSAFDGLTEVEKVEAIRRMCSAALALSANMFAVLAKRGLLHPDEVEVVLSTLADLFDKLPETLRESFSEKLTGKMEDIKRVAAENWSEV